MRQSTRPATDPWVPQSVRFVISQHRVAFAVAIGCYAMVPALVSWFLAAVSLTGVEPNGEFVDCGPALLGRPSPLPDPTCGDEVGWVGDWRGDAVAFRFQPPPVEPCMRFSRTRLTDALHRGVRWSPPGPVGSGCDDDSVEGDQAERIG